MQLIRGLHNLRERHRPAVVAIGNFDGLHLGHRRVIELIVEKAAEYRAHSTVIIFEPQPREFFSENPPVRLSPWRQKILQLADAGVEQVLTVRFDAKVAGMPAAEFARRALAEGLAARCVIVGQDFRFGHRREGDLAFLRAFGEQHGFDVLTAPNVELDGRRVSSSWVRECIAAGDLEMARRLLGRDDLLLEESA